MTPASKPLTGTQYEIAAGGYSAIATELGAGLRELRHRDRPLIAGYPADELPPAAAGQQWLILVSLNGEHAATVKTAICYGPGCYL